MNFGREKGSRETMAGFIMGCSNAVAGQIREGRPAQSSVRGGKSLHPQEGGRRKTNSHIQEGRKKGWPKRASPVGNLMF